MTAYLALAAVLLLLALLVLALEPGHRRAQTLSPTDDLDRDRLDHELAAISARGVGRSPSRIIGLLAAAGRSTPWHRSPLGADEVDLAR